MTNYKNGPEEIKRIPRMPDAVLECLIRDSLFYELANRYEGENRDRLHGLMHDTAEEVLARVSLAAPSIASSAPADELPPLPKAGVTTDTHIDGKGHPAFTVDQMRAYAAAAIAAQQAAPKAALTDEQIHLIAVDCFGIPACAGERQFARRIEAAAGPNEGMLKCLWWIQNNPGAHPNNVRAVVAAALASLPAMEGA